MRYLSDFVKGAANAIPGIETHRLYKEWTALSVVGAALQRQVYYNQGRYLCRPNMYIVLVGNPGGGKSSAIEMLYSDVYERLCEPIYGTKEDKMAAEAIYKGYLNKDQLPRHMLRGKTSYADLVFNMPGLIDSVLINGKLVPGCSLAVVTSDFGTFMHSYEEDLQDLLTEAWDSRPVYEKGTKTAGRDTVKGPCLSWIACATPHSFVADMPANASKQGLLSRIIPVVVLDEESETFVDEPGTDEEVVDSLARDLGQIANIAGQYRFTPDAKEMVSSWLKNGMEPMPSDPLMKEYNTRRYPHLQKMCMAYAAGRRDDLEIRVEDWESAQELLFETEARMPLILRRFSMSDVGKLADDLVEVVKNKRKISIRMLKRIAIRTAKSMNDVDRTIQVLIDSGALNRDGDLITSGTGL